MKIVVTAGPTREHLDPVRFLSNPSTGRMGFAVARAAARRGHDVTLVTGPVAANLRVPVGVMRVDVVSAREMYAAVRTAVQGADALIATAAVADWRPAVCAVCKLKKTAMSGVLKLVRNPDILKKVNVPLKVGFAAETNDVLDEASRKCREKGLAFIVANDVTQKGCGFGTATNRVTFVFPEGRQVALPMMSKQCVAQRIVRQLEQIKKSQGKPLASER